MPQCTSLFVQQSRKPTLAPDSVFVGRGEVTCLCLYSAISHQIHKSHSVCVFFFCRVRVMWFSSGLLTGRHCSGLWLKMQKLWAKCSWATAHVPETVLYLTAFLFICVFIYNTWTYWYLTSTFPLFFLLTYTTLYKVLHHLLFILNCSLDIIFELKSCCGYKMTFVTRTCLKISLQSLKNPLHSWYNYVISSLHNIYALFKVSQHRDLLMKSW